MLRLGLALTLLLSVPAASGATDAGLPTRGVLTPGKSLGGLALGATADPALSIRRPGVVASIYTYGESVYGFALTLPSEPVCQ